MHCAIKRDVESTLQNAENLVFAADQCFSHWSRVLVTQNHVISRFFTFFTVILLFSPRNNYKCVDTKSFKLLFEVENDEDCGLLQDDSSDILDNACADPLLGSNVRFLLLSDLKQ